VGWEPLPDVFCLLYIPSCREDRELIDSLNLWEKKQKKQVPKGSVPHKTPKPSLGKNGGN
jgi:hypothetical protein